MTLKDYIDNIISLQRARNYREAYKVFQEALTLYPTNQFLQGSEIFLLLRTGNVKEARLRAEQRMDALRTNPFFLKTYVECLIKDKDKDKALEMIDRVLSWAIGDEKLYVSLADILLKITDRKRAVLFLQSALLYMPQSELIKDHIQRLNSQSLENKNLNYYRERFKDLPPERVIREIENLLVLPDLMEDISIRLYLAEALKRRGELKRASEVYVEALRIKDSPFVRKMLGYTYYKMKDWDNALIHLREAFLEDPNDHALYATMAKVLKERGNIPEAETLINEAIARHPDCKPLYGMIKKIAVKPKG